jgi:hypothetical protein
LFDTDHPSDAGNAPDGVMNYTHDSLDDQISKSFDKIPQRHLSGKIAESSPQSPSSTQRQSKGWLRHPLCVVDPFIRTKVKPGCPPTCMC